MRLSERFLTNRVLILIAAIVFLAALYGMARSIAILHTGFTWSEMDWNQDGHTSSSEFFESSDIGKRVITQHARECTEYFAFKDGRQVKIVCR
jgi:hypothetical protein